MTSTSIMMLILFISSAAVFTAEGQSGTPACVSNLVPCASFMGSTTKPPQTCCGPLKTAITTQIDCLCGLYNTPGLLQSFNINITQALDLPRRCDIDGASLAACSKVGGSAPSPAGTVAPTGTPGKDENGGGRIAGFGISGLLFLMSSVVMLLC
uniref:Bifunctional inhibitor/plant lipid transfer protein/seed storage helical domain-containing protein n=1 Tax=Kalanchoe fedtschenkoi TaxID=63787 RepID=A0A7N0UNT7_KALFE